MTVAAANPALRSWVPVSEGSDFPIQNLPFGVFRSSPSERGRIGVAIGDSILDLQAVHEVGVMRLRDSEATADVLNPLLAERGRLAEIRGRVSQLLTEGNGEVAGVRDRVLVSRDDVELLIPIAVGDYVDFYSSEQHARNVGRMFRPDGPPLLPNWKHVPIGYHGRSSTVVVSGTAIRRPEGQTKPRDGPPVFGPTTRLDFEMEVGFVTCGGNVLGSPIPVGTAESHIAGLVLVNDWSARDLQGWEYQPLGPFLGKSFATTISPWLVTLEALAPYRLPAPLQDPQPLPYLQAEPNMGLDLNLEVELNGTVISRMSFGDMYWTMGQQLAHVASNGSIVRPGDLFASGTVSGAEPGEYGSLLELSWNGTKPFVVGDSDTRTYLEDGDTVVLRGHCDNGGVRVGFGACEGTIVPVVEDGG